jgi:hypothetical protein
MPARTIRPIGPTCGVAIAPWTAIDRAGDRASWPRTACGKLCAAKLASAAPSAAVANTVSMTMASSRRE